MKIKQDENYFLATGQSTGQCTSNDLYFLIEQKSEYSRISTTLPPKHAKMLRDEIDLWLKQIDEELEGEDEE